jgi:hypothetical protein
MGPKHRQVEARRRSEANYARRQPRVSFAARGGGSETSTRGLNEAIKIAKAQDSLRQESDRDARQRFEDELLRILSPH